ncbi:odorant receptor 13a-like isoform X3 [Camponotus floridanus]|uniref:odorant receptor 13a-like isoform X3 n=1 Tax=Camponotus floridanus TaxID=104421 RepID=UPI000DC6B87C|nr:odorant receptor 13a-like isoform X3 [Camponotus floridanus]
MISIKNRHFNVHRILLLAIGLWPCQRSRLVQFQMILCFGILVSSIGFQVERPLEELQHICNELKDKEEIVIMKKYGDNIKRFTFYALVLYICDLIILLPTISLSIMPNTFTVALHISESELRHILYKYIPKYFVDRKNYLCVVLLYFDAIVCIGATTFLATGLMLFAYLKHACGMLRIASYRIKKAINIRNNICPKNEAIMYKGIIYAIHIHRTAIKFSTFLFSYLHLSHFFLIVVGVICLSLNFYAISKIVSHGDKVDKFLFHFIIVTVIFVYLFLANYAGQELTDHNNDVFFTIYNVQWYGTPLRIQRLILFLLQRGSKTMNLSLGGISTLSLEFFATLTKASISYFTVMYSAQQ